mgnify:CR=1 FL=1
MDLVFTELRRNNMNKFFFPLFLALSLSGCGQFINTHSSQINKSCIFNERLMQNTQVFNIYFDFDHYKITPLEKEQLSELIEILKTNKNEEKISLLGYTDSVGSRKYNRILAEKRTAEVKSFLINNGINNIDYTAGIGKTHLPAKCDLIKNKKQRNDCNQDFRRVEIIVYLTSKKQ